MVGKLMPWCSWQEWWQVKVWLTSPNAHEQLLGIHRVRERCTGSPAKPHHHGCATEGVRSRWAEVTAQVTAWRSRGRLPLSVDVTAALLEVAQQDAGWAAAAPGSSQHGGVGPGEGCAPRASDHSLRLRYSLVLIRYGHELMPAQPPTMVPACQHTPLHDTPPCRAAHLFVQKRALRCPHPRLDACCSRLTRRATVLPPPAGWSTASRTPCRRERWLPQWRGWQPQQACPACW